jgi:hypothetical protein
MSLQSKTFLMSRKIASAAPFLREAWARIAKRYVWNARRINDMDLYGKRIFVIVGLARSGTTMLSAMVKSLPGVTCVSEPHRSWYLSGEISYDSKKWRSLPSAFIENLCRSHSATHIGFKETFFSKVHDTDHANADFFDRLSRNLPVIGLVRDPRDIYASIENYGDGSLASRSNVPDAFIHTWNTFTEWTNERADLTLRYEDVVNDPSMHLLDIFDVLVSKKGHSIPTYQNASPDEGDFSLGPISGIGDPSALGGGKISTNSIGKYRYRLDSHKIAKIERLCARHMSLLRYGH